MPDIFNFSYNEFQVPLHDSLLQFFVDDGFVNSNKYASENHHHDFNEIIYIRKGSAEITVQGGTMQVKESNMLLIPANLEHSLRGYEDTVFITISYWGELTDRIKHSRATIPSISVFCNPHLSNAFGRIADYYNEKHAYKQELLSLCFREIMHLIKELSERNESAQQKQVTLESSNYRNYIVERYFQERFNKSPKITELSEILKLSTIQTQRIIKKMYGITFCEKILQMRMAYANTLLLKNELPISEIVFKVGYNTESNFFSTFKRYYGITPKQYRKKHIKP